GGRGVSHRWGDARSDQVQSSGSRARFEDPHAQRRGVQAWGVLRGKVRRQPGGGPAQQPHGNSGCNEEDQGKMKAPSSQAVLDRI
ncbi:unnamed protein product, partial [Tetraodon nigroviridis]